MNRNAWAVAWWSSTQKPIKSPGAIWIVFWVCPVKRPEPRQGSCWQLEVVPWRKKGIWYVVLELHFVTRLGLTSTLIVCTGPWHLKGRKRCHCYVLYCSLHSACNTVHKKCLRWENKKIRKKIVKKCEDFISTHILQEKENGKTISLTVRTHCYCQPNQWFSSKSKSLKFLSKFIQIHLISMHTIQTWRKRAEEKNYDVWKVHHQQQSLSQQWQSESLLQTWHFSPG